jgi:hypothetical protein
MHYRSLSAKTFNFNDYADKCHVFNRTYIFHFTKSSNNVKMTIVFDLLSTFYLIYFVYMYLTIAPEIAIYI